MKLKTLMIINAIVAIVFGVTFVIVPTQAYSLYDITADEQLIYMGQLFGAALIGFALLTWMARNATDSDARRAIVLALFIADGIGFVVALIGQLSNVVNALGWSTVAIYLLLALGFGYFQFFKPASSQA
jgi:DMSO reductase anchor subunit